MKLAKALDRIADETGYFIVAWKLREARIGDMKMFDSYLAAERFLCELPVARDCEYKFISSPKD